MYVNSNNKTNIAPIPILLLQRFKIKIVEKKKTNDQDYLMYTKFMSLTKRVLKTITSTLKI